MAAVAIVGVLAYLNTLSNDLVFDDLGFLTGNVALQRPWDLAAIFGGPYRLFDLPTALYRPLTVWSIAVDTRINLALGLAPAAPTVLHLTNLLLHAGAGVALFAWLTSLAWPVRWSLLTAAVFAVHPIHVEAVAAIVGRAELLAALFGLLMLTAHRRRRHVAWCVVLYLFAMWSKESAATFLAVAVAMDVAFRHETDRWPIRRYAAYVATFGVWLTCRAMNLSGETPAIAFVDNPAASAPVWSRWLTAARVQLEYLQRLLVPVDLSSDYSYSQIPVVTSVLDVHVLAAAAVALGVVAFCWRTRRSHAVVWFAVIAYLAWFATTSNVVMPIGTIMGERLAYAPSIALCLLIGYAGWRLERRAPRASAVGAAVVIVLFAALTVARNRTWADEITFYRTQVASAPGSAKAHFGLGVALAAKRDDAAAIVEYERALAIYPRYPDVYLNLGNALRRRGDDPARVIAAYQGALNVDPSYTPALANLARFLMQQGRDAEAQPLLARLQVLDPGAVRTE